MRKIINLVIQTIFFVVILAIIVTLLSAKFSVFGLRSYTVATGSMEPKLHVGSVVFTLPASQYHVGNIITFNRGDISITHRIYAIKNGAYITKGDANKTADTQPVVRSNIVGRDILILPYFGKFTSFLKTPLGFLLFIGFPILIYVLFEARLFKREWEKQIEQKVRDQIEPFGFKIL